MLAHSDSCKPKEKPLKAYAKCLQTYRKKNTQKKKKITSNKHNSGADGLK